MALAKELGCSETSLLKVARFYGVALDAGGNPGAPSKAVAKEELVEVLEKTDYNRTAAAKLLGINVGTVRRWAHEYGIELPDSATLRKKRRVVEEEITAEEEHRLKQELKQVKTQLKVQLDRNIRDEDVRRLFLKASEFKLQKPKFLTPPPRKRKKERAQVVAMFSDWHFDEVVQPAEFNWANAYNREIATLRLRKYFRSLVKVCRDYINGVEIEGLNFAMLGDNLSGIIHEELRQTNDAPMMDGVLYWSKEIADGLTLLLDHFPQIYAMGIVGNHGRLDRKPRYKLRAKENFDWLLYHLIARYFLNVPEITFAIPESADWGWNVYGKRLHTTHGDQFRGGSGISGILSPVMLGDHRKIRREFGIGTPYDYLMMGHFHQQYDFGRVLINGSGKGYDEYAALHNFPFEIPQQAMFLCDPEHGKIDWRGIRVRDSSENWERITVDAPGY